MGGDPGLNVCYFFKINQIDLDLLIPKISLDVSKSKHVVCYVEKKFGRLLNEFLVDVDESIHNVLRKYPVTDGRIKDPGFDSRSSQTVLFLFMTFMQSSI